MTEYNGIVQNLDESEYHSHPALSSTGARKLLDSPARFRYYMDHPQPGKTSFDLGHAVHAKVLGVGADVIAYPEEHLTKSGNVSTAKATVDWAVEQRALGLTPISPEQMLSVDAMSESVLAHPTVRLLFEQEGQAEASVFATDPETGVPLRARFDFLPDLNGKNPVAVDLKSTGKEASELEFTKTVANYGYDTQEEHYEHTLNLATGQEIPFVFAVVETAPPYLVAVYQLPLIWREMGATKARRARKIFAECTKTGVWPGYAGDVQLLSPPTWLIFQHEEQYSND